ncbi:hypothetical protein B2J88_00125 [Rhodococcus sp. SRB_17]|nr:hypothetical protein [Rhodococcus sp. SRB_17]
MTLISPLLQGLCDDAALFPPGNAPLAEAIPAHHAYRRADYAALVGPFIFPAPRLGELAAQLSGDSSLSLSLTVPTGPADTAAALASAVDLPGVRVIAVEVGTPAGVTADEAFEELARIRSTYPDIEIFVEVPRDGRRGDYLAALTAAGYSAKFRTGGIVAEAYPDEGELADAIIFVVRAGIPFKATAGLHHAVRNTDPDTGFEQHGFLNILTAVTVAAADGDRSDVVAALAERDGSAIARALSGVTDKAAADVRRRFLSFGTCSITDPLTELESLGLISVGPKTEGTLV